MISYITTYIETLLAMLLNEYQLLAYLLIFLILFIETGIVIFPLLPGDSILFLAGALSLSKSPSTIFLLSIFLSFAAIIGDSFNYFIGKYIGRKIIKKDLIKIEYLNKTENFFKKYGNKAIIFARFIPIMRTIIPFTAGIGKMDYKKFISFNIIGGIAWVFIFVFAGYLFGNIPIVKNNISLIILLIVIVSVIIPFVEYLVTKNKKH